MIQSIHFSRVYLQTGVHTKQVTGLKGEDLLGSSMPPGVEKFWAILIRDANPRTPARWLEVHASHLTVVKDKEPVDALFARDKPRPGLIAAELQRDSKVTLTLKVNTDHPDYRAAVEKAKPNGTIHHELIVNTAARTNGKQDEDQIAIKVILTNVEAMPAYPGFVALDLGNTSSTLVYRRRGLNVSPEIRMVQSREQPGGQPEPATSALRIKSIRPAPATAPKNYKVCECLIGQDALEGSPPVRQPLPRGQAAALRPSRPQRVEDGPVPRRGPSHRAGPDRARRAIHLQDA